MAVAGFAAGSFAVSSGGSKLEGIFWGGGAVLLLVLSLSRFFFRSNFAIDDEGIWARYPLRKKYLRWGDVRRFAHDEEGGFLSTRVRASRMDVYRGMYLRFGDAGKEVAARIEAIRKSFEDRE